MKFKLFSHSLAAAGLFWAGAASAMDHPYGAPAALKAPASTRISPYWSQQAAYEPAPTTSPSDLKPEAVPSADSVVEDYNGYDGGYGGYGDTGYGSCGCDSPDFAGAMSCGCYDSCYRFYGSVGALVMTRTKSQSVFVTFDNTNINDQILSTRDAVLDWQGGFQVTAGMRFGCGMNNALEVSYWTLGRLNGNASITGTGTNLNTPIDVGFVDFGVDPARNYFDNAQMHQVYRNNQFHNLELNFIRTPICCGDRFQFGLLAGVRWFQFDENLVFSSYQRTGEAAHLNIDVQNNLVGFQIGARSALCITPGLRLFANPKVGLYGNAMDANIGLYNQAGVNGTANPPAPGIQRNFPLGGNNSDVAILSELDVGLDYCIGCHWRVFAGYRIVAISGVALADQQIPPFLVDVPEWENVDNVGNLFLHGAFAGAELRF
jgi:hypothetical protein